MQSGVYTRTDLGRSGLAWPRFYIETYHDEGASGRAGRPIFGEREMVEIFLPGNTLNRPVEIVREHHRLQWAKEYEAFKAGREPSADGWPLEQWPALPPARIMELKAIGFRSVEDVAGMSEVAISQIGMGARKLKELANAFLDEAENTRQVVQKTEEVEQLRAQVEAQANQIAELGALMKKMHEDAMARAAAPAQLAAVPQAYPSPPVEIATHGRGFDDLPAPRRRSAGMTDEQRAAVGRRLKEARAAKRAERE